MINRISPFILIGFLMAALPSMAQFKTIPEGNVITAEQKQQSRLLSNANPAIKGQGIQSQLLNGIIQSDYHSLDLQGARQVLGLNKFGGAKYVRTSTVSGDRAAFSSIIGQFAKATDIKELGSQAELDASWTDEIGHTHYRFGQYVNGLRIYGSQSILHINAEGESYLQSELVPDDYPMADKVAGISENSLKNTIIQTLDGYTEITGENLRLIDGNQWDIEEVYYFHEGELVQAYFVKVYSKVDDRQEFFVDAAEGQLLHKHSTICKFHNHVHDHSVDHNDGQEKVLVDGAVVSTGSDLFGLNRTINTYEVGTRQYLIDATRDMYSPSQSNMPNEPVGVLWTIDAFNTSPQNNNFNYDHVSVTNNNWSNRETAISAHYNAGLSYQYFNDKFNRNAIDDNGGNIISIINVSDESGNSMGNAFWNGAAMFYGNGDSAFLPLGRGLDVAGHELSHGVIQNTANLEYQGESGALNESFADVFGAMIDRDDWLIGEDVVRTAAFPSGALRSLSDPHNGASTNDFNSGWQPRHYSERFTGSADNGGVHINSGIPNYAFFLFASDVGKEMAENVYYRALTTYLSRSSQFRDCRAAVVQAATDIGDASVVAAANSAFDQVGIAGNGSTGGTTYETDADQNLGADFVVYGATDLSNLKIADGDGAVIADPFVDMGVLSRPSVTDDGSVIVFVSDDNHIQLISIDWATGYFDVEQFTDQPVWRNVVISKDGLRLAALTEELEPVIYVFEFSSGITQPYTLFNPTFTEGISTGDVNYADAMEFDLSGQTLIYDAFNTITGTTGTIDYWDIGFIDVYDRSTQNFADGNIQKLFTALPENVSIGNPTFSKNSPYIIALDVLEGGDFALGGYNIETSEYNVITELFDIGFPNYSSDDSKIVYDLPWLFGLDIGSIDLASDKITGIPNTENFFIENAKWGVFFSNGTRDLFVNTNDLDVEEMSVVPNPASETVILSGEQLVNAEQIEMVDQLGRVVYQSEVRAVDQHTIDVSIYRSGMYTIRVLKDSELLGISRLVVR